MTPAYAGQAHVPMFLSQERTRNPRGKAGIAGATGFVWPSAANTPSVSGSTLTYYPGLMTGDVTPSTTTLTLNSGDIFTSSANQVIQDKDITGAVVVNHNDVIIRRCRIRDWTYFGVFIDSGVTAGHPVVVEDCLIEAPVNPGTNGSTAVGSNHFTVRRCRIRGVGNGFDATANILIEYNFLYPLYNMPPEHADGLQTSSGAGADIANLTFRHNTVFSRGENGSGEGDGSSCLQMSLGSASFTNVTVHHNFMAGGSYALYGPSAGGTAPTTGTNVQVTDNHFGTNFNSTVGSFDVWTGVEDEAVVTGNIVVDSADNFIRNQP